MIRKSRLKNLKPDPGLPLGYLSPSAVNSYASCPMAYKLQYIDRAPKQSSPHLAEGLALHNVLERLHSERMSEKKAWDLWEYFAEQFPDITDDAVERAKVFVRLALETLPQMWGDDDKVEIGVEALVGGVPMIGYIDLLQPDVVTDYKVVKTKSKLDAIEQGVQMNFYSIATEIENVRHVCFVKTKSPKMEVVEGKTTERTREKIHNYVQSVADGIKAGNFPYAPPDSWKCNIKSCQVWHYCKQGGQREP